MSILRLSAEAISAGDTQGDLISDRIKTSDTVWGVSAPSCGQAALLTFLLYFFCFIRKLCRRVILFLVS